MGGGRGYGRVEVYQSGRWNTVCNNTWDINDARVVCRQLGFTGALRTVSGAAYGEGSGAIWMVYVMCSGREEMLSDCPFLHLGPHDCSHSDDAGVACHM